MALIQLIAPLKAQISARLRSEAGRGLIYSFGVSMTARFSQLILAILLARQLGPADYGLFTFATGVAMIGGQFCSLGWPMLMNRLIPKLRLEQDWPGLRGLVQAGDLVVLSSSVVGATILVAISYAFSRLQAGLLLAALLMVPYAFTLLRRQQLAAVKRAPIGLALDQGFGAFLLVLIILAFGTLDVETAFLCFTFALGLGVLISTFIFRGQLPAETRTVRGRMQLRLWLATAAPMVVGASSNLLMNRADVLMIGPIAGLYEVGLYGAAFRVTYVLSFPQLVMSFILLPALGQAFAGDNIRQVRRLLKLSMIYASLTTLPAALIILGLAEPIMTGVFGDKYTVAAPTLMLLTISQTAASIALAFSGTLMMGGREKAFGVLSLLSLGLNLIANLILVPRYGAYGAGMASIMSALTQLTGTIVLSRPLLVLSSRADRTPPP